MFVYSFYFGMHNFRVAINESRNDKGFTYIMFVSKQTKKKERTQKCTSEREQIHLLTTI